MKIFKIVIICLVLFAFVKEDALAFDNIARRSLRKLFEENNAIIYAINIRTFGAKDIDGDEIIDIYKGDRKGTFLNARERLKEIQNLGFNTIYLLPVTKTGKLKALGTAGSLYAMDSFNTLNPQFDDDDPKTVEEEAKEFIDEAHRLGMYVIIDMPCAGSYDMSLENKNLFLKDKNGASVVPSDWTDIRLFKIYEGRNLNLEVLNGYKSFVDMVQNLGADGIRADVAGIKPKEFWIELINYARRNNDDFLFLAEANPNWKNPVKEQNFYTTVQNLLDCGFDGYYGEYGDWKNLQKKQDFKKKIKNEKKILKKFDNKKSTITTFVTHDAQSLTINDSEGKSEMFIWLSATLPSNPYFLDGFTTGDSFIYPYENKRAEYSTTDDDYYFVHRGKMDIFNFSRAPRGKFTNLLNDTKTSLEFRKNNSEIFRNKKIKILSNNNNNIFSYSRGDKERYIVVAGNLNNEEKQQVRIKVRNISDNTYIIPIKGKVEAKIKGNSINIELNPLEIQVYLIETKKN